MLILSVEPRTVKGNLMTINLEDMKGFIYHGTGHYGSWRRPVQRP